MKHEQKKYGIVAGLMVLLIMGSLLWIEHMAETNVLGFVLFGFVCSAVLLYSLIKLDVMEFQPGSFWDRLCQRINQRKNRRHRRSGFFQWKQGSQAFLSLLIAVRRDGKEFGDLLFFVREGTKELIK